MSGLRRAVVLLPCFALLTACGGDARSSGPTATLGHDNLKPGVPDGWSGFTAPNYSVGLDLTDHHGGSASLYIAASSASAGNYASVAQLVRSDAFQGKRARLSAWVKQTSTAGSQIGLWMRIDGPGVTFGFDGMVDRPITGSGDWHQVSIVLAVPSNALGISFGILSNGSGTLLVDDIALDAVGNDVPTTSGLTSNAISSDSATIAGAYSRARTAPVNLDFEGVTAISSAAVDWLAKNSTALSTTDPAQRLDDLQPLQAMIGSAHVVGLGEDTHGTREFFQMKHRLLKYLVTNLGFTYFAIEATSPESDDMNRYVLTGDGDPHRLLSRLYFWTWNTQEVFDMIQWMRQWNTTAPPSQRVQFLGFDMQYPGASMDSVLAYVTRLDPDNITYVTTRYQCMASYRNHAQVIESTSGYATLPTATQLVCAGALQDVYDLIRQSAAKYTAASSPAVYEQMLHHARLVQQFEMMISGRPGAASRDQSMAENVRWIRDHAPVGAKIALWAHNGHIDAVSGTMGGAIRDAYGADYVPLGFVFGTGSFNAVGTPTGGLGAWQTTLIPPASIEAAFSGVGKPLVLFDTRRIPSGGTAAAPLAGPIPMRSIGAVWSQGNDALYFGNEIFPNDFNLLIYVAHTTQSSLLPFTY